MSNVERFLKVLRHFYPIHNQRFESTVPGSYQFTGEYYGRGGLEGLASGLAVAREFMTPEEQAELMDKMDNKEKAYLEVWGEDRLSEMGREPTP